MDASSYISESRRKRFNPPLKAILVVDELILSSTTEIVRKKIFTCTDAFLSETFPGLNIAPGVVLIEAMAQCSGAGIKKLGLASGYFALVNIESAHFTSAVEYQKVFNMVITN